MKNYRNTLLELGCEELPASEQAPLISALSRQVAEQLTLRRLKWTRMDGFSGPRRLALLIRNLSVRGEDGRIVKEGPAKAVAYAADGSPTPACEGFARSCGVGVRELSLRRTATGERLCYEKRLVGEETAKILPNILDQALSPLSRGMRWDQSPVPFIRPVRWLVLMADAQVIPWCRFGLRSENKTYGHRFLAAAELRIDKAADYENILAAHKVILDQHKRVQLIRDQARRVADEAGARLILPKELAHEIAALTEYPVAYMGRFDKKFLQLPHEVLHSILCGTQKYLMLTDKRNRPLPSFIFIANLPSKQPQRLIRGNEAVIKPRLEDAVFFYEQDRKTALEKRSDALEQVAFFSGLGNMKQKSLRVASLACMLAEQLGLKKEPLLRAARLCKCDLISLMVQEFPQLQGIMGSYYLLDGKEKPSAGDKECAALMRHHYLPRRAGDPLPPSLEGCVLSLSDKLDSLYGLFLSDHRLSGTGDPYGLRRNALAIIRILIEKRLDLNLHPLLCRCATSYAEQSAPRRDKTITSIMQFMKERIFSYGAERRLSSEILLAAFASYEEEGRILRSWLKAAALMHIGAQDLSRLVRLNKRLKNILKEAKAPPTEFDPLQAENREETSLYESYQRLGRKARQCEKQLNYAEACHALIGLTEPLAIFFDEVMVMVEDPVVRNNRLALLNQIYALFLHLGDLTVLSVKEAGEGMK